MEFEPLEQTLERVETEPRSGQSLLLYALIKTLSVPQGGHAYLLTKLREMEPRTRRLAYGLMEMMARGYNARPEWSEAVARMDRAMSGGS